MTATTLNLPLAEAVLKQITEHPETHKQDSWGFRTDDCGTTHCIAGWALALTPGVSFVWIPWRGGWDADAALLPGGSAPYEPEDAGRDALGLDAATAEHLFWDLTEAEAVDYLRGLIAAAKRSAVSP